MKVKFLFTCLMFCFFSSTTMAEDGQPTFKDRLKAKFKERLLNKMEEKPAPVLSSGVEGVIS